MGKGAATQALLGEDGQMKKPREPRLYQCSTCGSMHGEAILAVVNDEGILRIARRLSTLRHPAGD
jgi:hypothetical protein